MGRVILLMSLLVIVTALNSWGAERKRPEPLMPPEFPQSPFGVTHGDPKRGQAIYEQNGCSSCHLIEGKGSKIGPDLSRVGERRTVPDSYRQLLVNSHKPPVILVERDMNDLIAYLQSLKFFR